MNNMTDKELCAAILNYYQVADSATATDIMDLLIRKSDMYALGSVYQFTYKDSVFYICDDYSLDDNPAYLEDVLSSINHLLKGQPIKNPHPQSDGAQYAGGLNNTEYYLWKAN